MLPTGHHTRCSHLAAENGRTACLQRLITMDPAAASADGYFGMIPAHLAAQNGHMGALNVLLAAAPGTAAHQAADGTTPLDHAAMRGHTAVVERLLSVAPHTVNMRSKDGAAPLYGAAQNGHEDVVAALLRAGAVHTPTNPAHAAARGDPYTAHAGHAGALRRILQADPEASQRRDAEASAAAVCCACRVCACCHPACCHQTAGAAIQQPMLLKATLCADLAHVSALRPQGRTPLDVAMRYRRVNTMQVLQEQGQRSK